MKTETGNVLLCNIFSHEQPQPFWLKKKSGSRGGGGGGGGVDFFVRGDDLNFCYF